MARNLLAQAIRGGHSGDGGAQESGDGGAQAALLSAQRDPTPHPLQRQPPSSHSAAHPSRWRANASSESLEDPAQLWAQAQAQIRSQTRAQAEAYAQIQAHTQVQSKAQLQDKVSAALGCIQLSNQQGSPTGSASSSPAGSVSSTPPGSAERGRQRGARPCQTSSKLLLPTNPRPSSASSSSSSTALPASPQEDGGEVITCSLGLVPAGGHLPSRSEMPSAAAGPAVPPTTTVEETSGLAGSVGRVSASSLLHLSPYTMPQPSPAITTSASSEHVHAEHIEVASAYVSGDSSGCKISDGNNRGRPSLPPISEPSWAASLPLSREALQPIEEEGPLDEESTDDERGSSISRDFTSWSENECAAAADMAAGSSRKSPSPERKVAGYVMDQFSELREAIESEHAEHVRESGALLWYVKEEILRVTEMVNQAQRDILGQVDTQVALAVAKVTEQLEGERRTRARDVQELRAIVACSSAGSTSGNPLHEGSTISTKMPAEQEQLIKGARAEWEALSDDVAMLRHRLSSDLESWHHKAAQELDSMREKLVSTPRGSVCLSRRELVEMTAEVVNTLTTRYPKECSQEPGPPRAATPDSLAARMAMRSVTPRPRQPSLAGPKMPSGAAISPAKHIASPLLPSRCTKLDVATIAAHRDRILSDNLTNQDAGLSPFGGGSSGHNASDDRSRIQVPVSPCESPARPHRMFWAEPDNVTQ
eukprot:gnl/TRDRNA2_/TRDRNA2_146973_c0_seq2.p1 gnl/TRDRNA2_/TRDRNA2_146973_c0~~gnl/TRDRNA2_/TRDRNA2_146973_c0_seq2.p1  ORF type:complete len:708 (-),score=90.10 gnl/TRDRNA2_/TRDRNA2_146973_c0_seq2:34-2157(-)